MINNKTNFDTFDLFDFDKFRKFIIKNNVIISAMSIPIGYLIKNFIEFILNEIFFKFLDSFNSFNKLKKKTIMINNYKFEYGNLMHEFLKTLATLYLIFLISRFLQVYIE